MYLIILHCLELTFGLLTCHRSGGVAQWLGRRSVVGGLSLIYA